MYDDQWDDGEDEPAVAVVLRVRAGQIADHLARNLNLRWAWAWSSQDRLSLLEAVLDLLAQEIIEVGPGLHGCAPLKEKEMCPWHPESPRFHARPPEDNP